MFYASDFRKIARESLTNKWPLAIGTGLVASILGATGSGSIPDIEWRNMEDLAYTDFGNLFLLIFAGFFGTAMIFTLIKFIIGGAVSLGYCRFNKNLIDRANPRFMDLFSRFDIFGRAFLMQLLIGIYTFLWTLLFIIPGIIAAFSYAMTPYILEENPYMPVNEAIGRSKEMMRGNKFRLFCLQFSFIGWSLLCLLTCGIGYLWLGPYMQAATAAFFYDVSGKFNSQYTAPNGDQMQM